MRMLCVLCSVNRSIEALSLNQSKLNRLPPNPHTAPHNVTASSMPAALTIALEKDDGCFLPSDTIRGTLTLKPGTEQQQPLREGRAVVTVGFTWGPCENGWGFGNQRRPRHHIAMYRPTHLSPRQLAGGLHVEWEEGGHSGDDTGVLRYAVDRASW